MKKIFSALAAVLPLLLLAGAQLNAQDRPWQNIVVPSYADAAAQFLEPPPEYGLTIWWWWNGDMTEDEIIRDLRDIKAHNVNSVLLWAYYGLSIEYLSPLWFERVRFAVEQARKLNMRIWLMDEGSYPSGFAGGKISKEHPELRMQVLTSQRIPARAGEPLSIDLPPDLASVAAVDEAAHKAIPLEGSPGAALRWTPPQGEWSVVVVRHEFRTSPTRHVNNPGFKKDSTYSFADALDPKATRQFLAYVHEEYKKYIGDQFGKTVLGFMGDEPSFPGTPWTPKMLEEFERRKGYDVRPHLAKLFTQDITPDARLIRADYWDVWTDLYRDEFFDIQADWCGRHAMDYIVHLCGEEDMKVLLRLNGDYFKCNRKVQIPGVDAIWRQIWPDKISDYPKLASSAAHLFGRPRSFTESYGVYGAGLSIEQAKWVMDQQFVRGINQFQAMGYSSSNAEFRKTFGPPNWNGDPQWAYFPELAKYSNRLSYLLSLGRPAAEIAIYYPTTSGWLGDFEADRSSLSIARALLERQRDFDFVDEQALQSVLTIRDGALWNSSGQPYRALIIPNVVTISKKALATIDAFARSGGKVLFMGRLPSVIPDKSFLRAESGSANPLVKGSAGRHPSVSVYGSDEVAEAVLAKLPRDVSLEPAAPSVKYLHRQWADGDMYFLFNESDKKLDLTSRFRGQGEPEIWDPLTGSRQQLRHKRDANMALVSLSLQPYETKVVVLSPRASSPMAPPAEVSSEWPLNGDFDLVLQGQTFSGSLKPWSEFGSAAFSGFGAYRKEFDLPESFLGAGRTVALDLGDVKYAARLKVNGHDLGPRAWRPFRWEVGEHLRSGRNVIEIEVSNTGANWLAADPARYKEIESKGWFQSAYVGMYLKFDKEMIPSGLIGPVRLLAGGVPRRAVASDGAAQVLEIGSRRELFVDRRP